MTAAEMIEELQKVDPQTQVGIREYSGADYVSPVINHIKSNAGDYILISTSVINMGPSFKGVVN